MSLPRWSDDELLHELGAALKESTVDEDIVRTASAAFIWRTVDADLELLGVTADSAQAAGALVRGGSGTPRTLAFHGERLSVEIEIDEAGIVGQLTPPQPGEVTLATGAGAEVTTQADEVGCFAFPRPAPGPLRLDCRVGADRFVTEWVTI